MRYAKPTVFGLSRIRYPIIVTAAVPPSAMSQGVAVVSSRRGVMRSPITRIAAEGD